jgi:hypothetical protein
VDFLRTCPRGREPIYFVLRFFTAVFLVVFFMDAIVEQF